MDIGKVALIFIRLFFNTRFFTLSLFHLFTFNYFKFELQFFPAKNIAQVKFPKLAREPKFRRFLVEINKKFDAERAPQIRQRNVGANGF